MTDETRVLAEAFLAAAMEDDRRPISGPLAGFEWYGTALDMADHALPELAKRGYSIVPTATLERARRIEEAARFASEKYHDLGVWNTERTNAMAALRAALRDGGES